MLKKLDFAPNHPGGHSSLEFGKAVLQALVSPLHPAGGQSGVCDLILYRWIPYNIRSCHLSASHEHLPDALVPSLVGGIVGLGRESSACDIAQLLLDDLLQQLKVALPWACCSVTVSFHAAKLLPILLLALGDFLQKLGVFLQSAFFCLRTKMSYILYQSINQEIEPLRYCVGVIW